MNIELRKDIYWVGYVDWTVRDFHGYNTTRGSTYNAYLVCDEKIAVIDSVKRPYGDKLLAHIRAQVDPRKVDYVVCNHAEPDHAGSLSELLEACPHAELVCDQKCLDVLKKYNATDSWKIMVVKDGQSLSLGRRTLRFIETPMAHWPESMFTYIPEEKLLFTMDAFGQHYASAGRFDDEEPLDILMYEAKTYYANILMLYGKPVRKVLDQAAGLDVEILAPSHGIIWRSHVPEIVKAYQDWVGCRPKPKVVILYDTMWNSTEQMAQALGDGASCSGVSVKILNVRANHITQVATEVLDAAVLAVGSPTLNMTVMPEVASALTYLKGLKPAGKVGLAFGSYGWGKNGVQEIEAYLQTMKVTLLSEALVCNYAPDAAMLDRCREMGRRLADAALTGAQNFKTL